MKDNCFFDVRDFEPDITNFVKECIQESDTFQKSDFRIIKFQNSKFSDFGQFKPDITDFVKNA